jgi:hypothetical protein
MVAGYIDSLVSSADDIEYKNDRTKSTPGETIAVLDSFKAFECNNMDEKQGHTRVYRMASSQFVLTNGIIPSL